MFISQNQYCILMDEKGGNSAVILTNDCSPSPYDTRDLQSPIRGHQRDNQINNTYSRMVFFPILYGRVCNNHVARVSNLLIFFNGHVL
jgi:hypothetical protein